MSPPSDDTPRDGRGPNRLSREKSPYLLQHAFNPVDWYPWGPEAFAKARSEDKPIFLSIGYSTCHWCHVMERESFESDEIAAVLNDHFVCIKVDREERPDVDKVYMTTVQALTGAGGWPLSVWLTPDLKPFYGGTYFPPDARFGRPGFPDLLRELSGAWNEKRSEVLASADRITETLQRLTISGTSETEVPWDQILRTGFSQFYASYDTRLGGFGSAPKFPRPVVFEFLLRYYARSGEQTALEMTLETLRQMWSGGMYDHLGGGFHRYSVDAYWRVPHFEKMLYDQAQLVWSYLEAYQATGDRFFADVVSEVLDYVVRDMTHPEGGFFSAEDADSAADPQHPDEKEEGAFYLWTKAEIIDLLGERDAELFNWRYGVSETGNTISDPHDEFRDRNVLYAAYSIEEAARQTGLPEAEARRLLEQSKRKLFEARSQRPRPHLDDKVITAWNGLMISAFARASSILEEEKYLRCAERAATFVLEKNHDPESGTLRRRYRDGEAKHRAQLDDYAFLILGLIDLYEASFDVRWLRRAVELTEAQNRTFGDSENGGFFDAPSGDDILLVRMKEFYDGAEPSGNSIAALNLMRLSQMLDRPEWWDLAARALSLFAGRLEREAHAMPQMLAAIDFHLGPPRQIVIAGRADGPDTRALLRAVHRRFLPNKILLLADGDEGQAFLAEAAPFWRSLAPVDGKATAYVCENYACQQPTTDLETLTALLEDRPAP